MKKSLPILVFLICIFSVSKAQWTLVNTGIADELYYVQVASPTAIYFETDIGTTYKSVNSGSSWSLINGLDAGFMQFISVDTAFVILGGGGGIEKTNDGCNTFSSIQLPETEMINFPTRKVGFALVCSSQTCDTLQTYKTSDGGASYGQKTSIIPLPMTSNLIRMQFFDTLNGVFLEANSGLYRTINGAHTWTKIDSVATKNGAAFYFLNKDTGYAVCTLGTLASYDLRKTTDGGKVWTHLSNLPNDLYYDMWFTSLDTGFVVGGDGISNGIILGTTNGGITMTTSHTSTNTYDCILFYNSKIGYAGGQNGEVVKFDGVLASVHENEFGNSFSIYPNPSTGNFQIAIKSMTPGYAEVAIYDLIGKQVFNSKENATSNGSLTKDIDLSACPKGMYIVQIKDGASVYTNKIVVQ